MAGKDYIVQVKVKNGPLLRAIRATGHANVHSFCRAHELSGAPIGEYLNLKRKPIKNNGEWSTTVLRLAEALRMLPEDLFPPQHLRKVLKTNVGETELGVADIAGMLTGPMKTPEDIMIEADAVDILRSQIDSLTPREREVLSARFGLDDGQECTLDDLAKLMGVSRERIRQIEAKAFRKMRHPGRENELRVALQMLTNA